SSATVCGSYGTSDGLIRSYASGNYRYLTYMFNNSDNLYTDNCTSDTYNSIESCTNSGTKEWRVYSADLNTLYYDPNQTFTPWIGPCLNNGTACANASFTSARSNPDQSQSGYSYTRNLSGNVYEVWIDDRGFNPSDQRPLRAASVNANSTPNGVIDLWDSHVRVQLNAANAQVYSITYSPNVLGLNATQTLRATLTSTTACYNVLGSKDLVTQVFNGSLSYTSTGQPGCRTLTEARSNFANWYQYYRRRAFVAKNAIGSVINRFGNYRYGLNVINNQLFIQMPNSSATDYSTQNQNLVNSLYGYTWQALGTPLRTGLARAGQYYNGTLSNTSSPIIYPCQQNFTVLVTDGFWNDTTGPSYVGDSDQDGISQTLADVARYYYITDLSSMKSYPQRMIRQPINIW
ncbi:MAG TPA: hypothetical protein PLD88_04185, partial [Candidatus Berkiella sp.]|nr:hypothetical protein [Candidatus Berkiella sp.]